MTVDTLALGPVTTSLVCLNYPLIIYGKNFGMDLVYLSLNKLDVILGMNWLEFNYVHINCYNKSVSFLDINEYEGMFVSAKQVNKVVNDGVQVFMMMLSMSAEVKVVINELPVVCEFPEVFPDDVRDFPPEQEVEFAIDLVPGTSLVSMALYRMSALDLGEMKKQLEELLEKKFVRPSDSP
ncbi:uncharacterized protein LOC127104506 [Lathyrus oleraceus]|uniref:uncharacterized protein LOC127104506 n=1 Tax=Pisum sativum TaxID=3888 RepID=UPI0021CFD84B|nr:uncharacterized protein LOC127104506 [Pisum sativum]